MCRDTHTYKEMDFKELTHAILKAGKSVAAGRAVGPPDSQERAESQGDCRQNVLGPDLALLH